MSADPTPLPRHSRSVPRLSIQPSLSPGEGVVGLEALVQTVRHHAVRDVDRDERQIGPRPVAADHLLPVVRRGGGGAPVVLEGGDLREADLLVPIVGPGHDVDALRARGIAGSAVSGRSSSSMYRTGRMPTLGEEMMGVLDVVVCNGADVARQRPARRPQLHFGPSDGPLHERRADAPPAEGGVHHTEDVAPLLAHLARQMVRVGVAGEATVDRRQPCVGGEHHVLIVEFLLQLVHLDDLGDEVVTMRTLVQCTHVCEVVGGQRPEFDRRHVGDGTWLGLSRLLSISVLTGRRYRRYCRRVPASRQLDAASFPGVLLAARVRRTVGRRGAVHRSAAPAAAVPAQHRAACRPTISPARCGWAWRKASRRSMATSPASARGCSRSPVGGWPTTGAPPCAAPPIRWIRTSSSALDAEPTHVDTDTVVLDQISAQGALDLIASSLPPDQAEVLLLRVIGELDVAHVAEVLDRTPNWVRVTQHRALRRLAEKLSESSTDPVMPDRPPTI